jgi:hypothetical protein
MAAVPIQIDGVLWDHALKSGRAVSLIGQAFIVGLGPGGGPIIPPDAPPMVPPPHPEHPIVLPPDQPPDIPPDVPSPVPPSAVIKPPPVTGGWGLHSTENGSLYWSYFPGPGAAVPKS